MIVVAVGFTVTIVLPLLFLLGVAGAGIVWYCLLGASVLLFWAGWWLVDQATRS